MTEEYRAYGKRDITNIYSALLSTSAEDIAAALFSENGAKPSCTDSFIVNGRNLAKTRIQAVLNMISGMQPNLESCQEAPIRPWLASDLSSLRKKCWPSILGMRIVFPETATRAQKGHMMCNLLRQMTSMA